MQNESMGSFFCVNHLVCCLSPAKPLSYDSHTHVLYVLQLQGKVLLLQLTRRCGAQLFFVAFPSVHNGTFLLKVLRHVTCPELSLLHSDIEIA